jgi:hypothetical protein
MGHYEFSVFTMASYGKNQNLLMNCIYTVNAPLPDWDHGIIEHIFKEGINLREPC